jgi:hypothetical protein
MSSNRMSILLTVLFTRFASFGVSECGLLHSNTCVWHVLSSPNAYVIIAAVSIIFFQRFAQNLMHTQLSDPVQNYVRPDT